MSRTFRITARGNERRDIFFEDKDREVFVSTLAATCGRLHWLCHGYCLMGNHYRLLVETPEGNLSKGMRHLNGFYI